MIDGKTKNKHDTSDVVNIDAVSGVSSGITKITLSNFRSYSKLRINCDASPVVLIGDNGVGKTNILEAISLFNSIKGMRGVKIDELIHQTTENNFTQSAAIAMSIQDKEVDTSMGLSIACVQEGTEKSFKVNGENLKSQGILRDYLNILWVTPQMDRIFSDGMTARRKLLDKIVSGFYKLHPGYMSKYDYLVRERMFLLKSGKSSNQWLDSLEKQIAEIAINIATYRLQTIDMLKQAQEYVLELFPVADFYIDGDCEENILRKSATEAEDILRAKLLANRKLDQESGRTACGTHRSDFKVIFANKGMLAEQCSTGEQKALLISIILTASRLQIMKGYPCPILLLDEIVAHLDQSRRKSLLQEIFHLNIQAWITTTEDESFKMYKDCLQMFKIVDGQLEKL